eukprot:4844914-Pyramimonas_sp.AAC.1
MWPTQPLEAPAARALDWVSSACIPDHLHIDCQRTDLILPFIEQFNMLPPRGAARKCGSDITNCFSNIPHPL